MSKQSRDLGLGFRVYNTYHARRTEVQWVVPTVPPALHENVGGVFQGRFCVETKGSVLSQSASVGVLYWAMYWTMYGQQSL